MANWISRPGPAPKILPKLGLSMAFTGVWKLVLLKMLKNSARNWCVMRSVIRVFFWTVKSKLTKAGRRMYFDLNFRRNTPSPGHARSASGDS